MESNLVRQRRLQLPYESQSVLLTLCPIMKVIFVLLALVHFGNLFTVKSSSVFLEKDWDSDSSNIVSLLAKATFRIIQKNFLATSATTIVLINKGNEKLANRILLDLKDFISVLFHPVGQEDFATHFILIGTTSNDIEY